MTAAELRQAFSELDGTRDLTVHFAQVGGEAATVTVPGAMLVPEEEDHLIKVTDGTAVYLIDAERVVWLKIGITQLT
jgi:hypothetical protein